MMMLMSSRTGKVVLGSLAGVAGLGLLTFGAILVYQTLPATAQSPAPRTAPEAPEKPKRLDTHTIAVPPEVIRSLDIRTTRVLAASRPRTLPPLPGCLAVDSNRLPCVRPRFAGEIVGLGTPADE